MGKIRTTTKATDQQVIKDKAEFCQTLDDIARKGVELDTLQAAKETAMQQVLTEHDPKISELAREIARLTKLAEQWASPRRDELFAKGRKSGTTALTTYGYRQGLDVGQDCRPAQEHPPQGLPGHQGDPGQGGNPPARQASQACQAGVGDQAGGDFLRREEHQG